MESGKVTIRLQRFDPDKDTQPRDQDYELELPPGITILKTLNKIRAEQDPTLAYRYSCGSAICGSCAMKVNGHARLSCKTQASECIKDGVMHVAPIGNSRVLRDLVVDLEPFWNSVGRVKPYLMPDSKEIAADQERQQTPDQFLHIDPSTTCILCAACFSDCNVLEVDENFLGPASLAKAHRFIFDSRDANDQPIPGYELADCEEITCNDVAWEVRWRGKADLSHLAGQPIKIHFRMTDAKLYAFQFVKD